MSRLGLKLQVSTLIGHLVIFKYFVGLQSARDMVLLKLVTSTEYNPNRAPNYFQIILNEVG